MWKIEAIGVHTLRDISDAFGLDESLLPPEERCTYAVALFVGGQPRALGLLWENPIHPHADYSLIYTAKPFRRMGYGRRLLLELRSASRTGVLQVGISSDCEEGIGFLEAMGFRCVRTTRMLHFHAAARSSNAAILPYARLPKDAQDRILRDAMEDYIRVHRHVNAAAFDLDFDRWRALQSDLVPSLSVTDGGASYMLVFADHPPCIGYVAGERETLAACISAALQICSTLSAEVDDDNPCAMQLMELADAVDAVTYQCYHLKV